MQSKMCIGRERGRIMKQKQQQEEEEGADRKE